MVLVEGNYSSWGYQHPSRGFSVTGVLNVAISGMVENIWLSLRSGTITLGDFATNGSLVNASVLISSSPVPNQRSSVTISGLTFVDSGISSDRYASESDASWIVSDATFLVAGQDARNAIFDFLALNTPTTTTTISFHRVSASLSAPGVTMPIYFIRSETYLREVSLFNTQVDGSSTFLLYANNGYGERLTVAESSITGIKNYLTYTTRFAPSIAQDKIGANDVNLAPSAQASNLDSNVNDAPLPFYSELLLSTLKAEFSGAPTASLATSLPRLAASPMALFAQTSNFSGLEMNCVPNTRRPYLITRVNSINANSLVHNCGACFGSGEATIWSTSFTYLSNDTRRIFTSFASVTDSLKMGDTNFIDLDETKVSPSRLYFSGSRNVMAGTNVRTNSLVLDVGTDLNMTSLILSGGTVNMSSGSRLGSHGSRSVWTFESPIHFKFNGGSDSSLPVIVDLSDLQTLEIKPSSDYTRDPGVKSIFYNDKQVNIALDQAESIYQKIHINWNATRFDIPLSNVPYFIGNFTLRDFNASSTPMQGELPMRAKDEFPFTEVIQAINAHEKLFRSFFALSNGSPIYVPTQQWPATPFAKPPPPMAPVTPPADLCLGPAPVVETTSPGQWVCSHGNWLLNGDLVVSRSSSLKISEQSGLVMLNGDLTMEEGSQVLFEGVSSELMVFGCINQLKKVSFDPMTPPQAGWSQAVIHESGCAFEHHFNASNAKLEYVNLHGCTQYSVRQVESAETWKLVVQFGVSHQKCKTMKVVYGVIGGLSAVVVIAGIAIIIFVMKRRRARLNQGYTRINE